MSTPVTPNSYQAAQNNGYPVQQGTSTTTNTSEIEASIFNAKTKDGKVTIKSGNNEVEATGKDVEVNAKNMHLKTEDITTEPVEKMTQQGNKAVYTVNGKVTHTIEKTSEHHIVYDKNNKMEFDTGEVRTKFIDRDANGKVTSTTVHLNKYMDINRSNKHTTYDEKGNISEIDIMNDTRRFFVSYKRDENGKVISAEYRLEPINDYDSPVKTYDVKYEDGKPVSATCAEGIETTNCSLDKIASLNRTIKNL